MAGEDFIGSGWAFPAAISRSGTVRLVSGLEEVDARLLVIEDRQVRGVHGDGTVDRREP